MPSRDTVLIIPAAGAGTRLRSSTPKVLAPVNGSPMIDHLLRRYRGTAGRFVLVVHPSTQEEIASHVRDVAPDLDVALARQDAPTGMLDAILLASEAARGVPEPRIWITWCDQVGVHPRTVATLAHLSDQESAPDLILPTVRQAHPYIHLERDASGRVSAIRQRREGDAMPAEGESDMGLFSLSARAYFEWLPQFGRGAAPAPGTGERNFLPFIPWLARNGHTVATFPSTHPMEAIGVNTPEDRLRLEAYLREIGPV